MPGPDGTLAGARRGEGRSRVPQGPRRPRPGPRGASAKVAAARQAERKARQAAAKAEAAQAAAEADPPGQASTTDPASRLMPAKKGGYDQHYNVQVLAGRGARPAPGPGQPPRTHKPPPPATPQHARQAPASYATASLEATPIGTTRGGHGS